MRKILIAFDGRHYSEKTIEFAKALHVLNPIMITGVFLPQISYANLWSYADGVGAPMFVPVLDDEETTLIERNVERFEEECRSNGIEYSVRKDFEDLALPELKKESRFTDLMLIGEDKFYEDTEEGKPSHYLKEAIHHVECPVLVIAEKNKFPALNILAYDGSESSMYAIKQFAYLLPEFLSLPTLLTYAETEEKKGIPFEPYMEEYVARHFPDLTITKLDLDAKKYYATWVADKKNAILVTGALGRSSLSQLFSKSFINDLLTERAAPIFIAHK